MLRLATSKPLLWKDIKTLVSNKLNHLKSLFKITVDPAGAFRDKISGGTWGILQPDYEKFMNWKRSISIEKENQTNLLSNGPKNDGHCEIERILAHKNTKTGIKLKVKWSDWDDIHNSWIILDDLNAPLLLKHYLEKNQLEIVGEKKNN